MKFTNRQKLLLANLGSIKPRKKASGRYGYFLAHEDCTSTITALLVRGVLIRAPNGASIKLAVDLDLSSLGELAT